MKAIKILYLIPLCVFFGSCEPEYADYEGINYEHLTFIGVSNWTGHWRNCSPGETLIFSVSVKHTTQEFTLPFNSDASFKAEFEEGDMIHIVVMDENRDIIHIRSKDFSPSDPEKSSPEGDKKPFIQVCDIDRLDLYGF